MYFLRGGFVIHRRFLECLLFPVLFFVFAGPAAPGLGAGIRFSGLDLAREPEAARPPAARLQSPAAGRLLFSAQTTGNSLPAREQSQLFFARLDELSVNRLSALPERLEILEGGKTLLVQSAFGAQSLSLAGGIPKAVPGYSPLFSDLVSAPAVLPSGDGKWLLFVEPVSFGRGDLALVNCETGERRRIAAALERPGRYFPAAWSPDSKLFVYSRSGKLYFWTVNTAAPPPSDENLRFIGEGGLNSLCWSGSGDGFYFMKGRVLYRVRVSDLVAATLYADFLDMGEIAAVLPFDFDPNRDFFRVSPGGSALLFFKAEKNIFYYPLQPEKEKAEVPFFDLLLSTPRRGWDVLWSGETATVILPPESPDGKAAAYRIKRGRAGFEKLPFPGTQAALSPQGDKALVWGGDEVFVFNYETWKAIRILSAKPALSCLWISNGEVIIGGEEIIGRVPLEGKASLICLSSAAEYGFERDGNLIFARSGESWFFTDGSLPWSEAGDNPILKEAAQASPAWRVYLEEKPAGFFENMPMIRNLAASATFPLFPAVNLPRAVPGSRPSRGLPTGGVEGVFNHGPRDSRKVSLVFDLYDDDAGLYHVLGVLERYGIRATFFLNGEFIRRHPEGAAALSFHETASMFFSLIDLSDSRYRPGRDFIARGLARNEDEFFDASGGEMALLWHPPWYALSPEIASWAASSGYKTTGRDIDPGDWIRVEDARRIGLTQLPAADMIDAVMDTIKNGSIIPIRLGLLPGGRSDYLFNSLEVLLDAIIRSGYEIVPISQL